MRHVIGSLVAVALLTGCAATKPKDAAQGVYEAESSLLAALQLTNDYAALPRCSATVKAPCSTQAVLQQANSAATAAWIALQNAQKVATDPTANATDVSKATASAQAAVATLVGITASLGVK